MKIVVPSLSLIVLVGPSGSGKTTFARKHFAATEVVSSDFCRALISDDEADQSVTPAAFELVHTIARKRLAAGRLTVVDATSVKAADREKLVQLAKQALVPAVALVFDLPAALCIERDAARGDRTVGAGVIGRHIEQLRAGLGDLRAEGFLEFHTFTAAAHVDAAAIERIRAAHDRRDDAGPFDIIGDVHGCCDELIELLTRLGWQFAGSENNSRVTHPRGRKAVFVGDLVDRGPATPAVLRLVMSMVESGAGLCVPGNHDDKLLRKLAGRDVKVAHGLAETLAQLENESSEFREQVRAFFDGLASHYVLAGGDLVVAHAGMKRELQGRTGVKVRAFALYGETTGETDEFGKPVRYNWAADYRGHAHVIYGHTPVPEPEWLNRTLCIDTGCVYGGKLTALRWPEKELVAVAARREYYARHR